MGPNDETNYVMMLDGQPIEFAEFTADMTTESETQSEREADIERGKAIADGIANGLKSSVCVFEYKVPKRYRCTTRKRFIKLRMADGASRNIANAEAQLLVDTFGYGWQDAYRMVRLAANRGGLTIY